MQERVKTCATKGVMYVHLKKSMNSATALTCQLCVLLMISFEFSQLNDSPTGVSFTIPTYILLDPPSTDQFVESNLCVFH